jgi:hypothetical protein
MRWTRRHKSSSLGMFRCIPRTCPRRYNHLSLVMPESSPYSSTNMRLSPSYCILHIHMICIALTYIIIAFMCLGFIFFNFIRLFILFLLLLYIHLWIENNKNSSFCFASLFGSLYFVPSWKALKKNTLGR